MGTQCLRPRIRTPYQPIFHSHTYHHIPLTPPSTPRIPLSHILQALWYPNCMVVYGYWKGLVTLQKTPRSKRGREGWKLLVLEPESGCRSKVHPAARSKPANYTYMLTLLLLPLSGIPTPRKYFRNLSGLVWFGFGLINQRPDAVSKAVSEFQPGCD